MRTRAKLLIVALTCATLCALWDWRVRRFHRSHPTQTVHFSDGLLRPDHVFAWTPQEDHTGYLRMPTGDVVFRHDQLGLRIPETGRRPGSKSILFLGCSYTHGLGVRAEETYPEIVASAMDARCYNGAVSGWGFAQMAIRARLLSVSLRPDIVIVQRSPWLAERASQKYRDVEKGSLPVPYYVASGAIQPPFARCPIDFLSVVAASDLTRLRSLLAPAPCSPIEAEAFALSEIRNAFPFARMETFYFDHPKPEHQIPGDGHPNRMGHALLAASLLGVLQ